LFEVAGLPSRRQFRETFDVPEHLAGYALELGTDQKTPRGRRNLPWCLRKERVDDERHQQLHPFWKLRPYIGSHGPDLQYGSGNKWRRHGRGQSARQFKGEHVVGLAELRDGAQDTELPREIDILIVNSAVLRGPAHHQYPGRVVGTTIGRKIGKQRPGERKAAEIVDGEIALDPVPRETELSAHDTGTQHQIVQPGPALRNLRRQCIDIADEAEVGLNKLDLVVARRLAQLPHGGCALAGTAANEDDRDALAGENMRDCLANSIRSAGHQRGALPPPRRARRRRGPGRIVDIHQLVAVW